MNDDENMIERKQVRYKYKFNLSNHSTIDSAVRDLIDRVSTYRHHNLNAYINGILPHSHNLSATIQVKSIRKWVKHLTATVTPVV